MTKEASIKCTGEKIKVKHVWKGNYIEVLDVETNNPWEKYGRTFHYSELNFDKKI